MDKGVLLKLGSFIDQSSVADVETVVVNLSQLRSRLLFLLDLILKLSDVK